nr:MAG TPA: KOW2-KOW3 domains of Spt5, Spt5, RNA processing, Transcription [Caudoviricetes sp.]
MFQVNDRIKMIGADETGVITSVLDSSRYVAKIDGDKFSRIVTRNQIYLTERTGWIFKTGDKVRVINDSVLKGEVGYVHRLSENSSTPHYTVKIISGHGSMTFSERDLAIMSTNQNDWTIMITGHGDITAMCLKLDGGTFISVPIHLRRHTTDDYDIGVAASEAIKKAFGINAETNHTDRVNVTKQWSGKIVCAKSNDENSFEIGHVYTVENGKVTYKDGSRSITTYNSLHEFQSLTKMGEFVELKEGTK